MRDKVRKRQRQANSHRDKDRAIENERDQAL